MALDTAYKRRNAAGVLPLPDGTIGHYDRRAAVGMYALIQLLTTAYKRRNAAGVAPAPDGTLGTHDRRAAVGVYAMSFVRLVFFLQGGEHMMADTGSGAYRLISMDVD